MTPHLEGITTPIIPAGGLTPENVGEAIKAVRPSRWMCRAAWSDRAAKDPELIRAFCKAVVRMRSCSERAFSPKTLTQPSPQGEGAVQSCCSAESIAVTVSASSSVSMSMTTSAIDR